MRIIVLLGNLDMAVDMQAFWDDRASLGEYAGTRDRVLKELEMREIARRLQGAKRVLDMGCGDGETARYLAERYSMVIDAVDFSTDMLSNLQRLSSSALGSVRYGCSDLFDWKGAEYDAVYTERCIINLPDWPTQLRAIQHLISLGKKYVMVESSQDGLNGLNRMRKWVGLPEIVPPSHTRYLRAEELCTAVLEEKLPNYVTVGFTGTYYFLSRVVNALLAQQEGREPDYEAPVNHLAFTIPSEIHYPDLGQTRLWIFEND
ncbi:hypothetical protein LCGC14_0313260 [marine sediment metagenome]|uniref:Methyltransferase domain-containing protein n=1 Tax=marine sediment metagenome TaxID=412755 RepID=A0A0F9TRU7_9ZZZZ